MGDSSEIKIKSEGGEASFLLAHSHMCFRSVFRVRFNGNDSTQLICAVSKSCNKFKIFSVEGTFEIVWTRSAVDPFCLIINKMTSSFLYQDRKGDVSRDSW